MTLRLHASHFDRAAGLLIMQVVGAIIEHLIRVIQMDIQQLIAAMYEIMEDKSRRLTLR